MSEQLNPSGLNPFGEVLQKLMDRRGIGAAELVARMRACPDAPAITEEDVEALMTAQPGEEFLRVAGAVKDAFLDEN
jgi:hypothetical protein